MCRCHGSEGAAGSRDMCSRGCPAVTSSQIPLARAGHLAEPRAQGCLLPPWAGPAVTPSSVAPMHLPTSPPLPPRRSPVKVLGPLFCVLLWSGFICATL